LVFILAILVVGVMLRGIYLGELRHMPELNHPPVDEGFSLYWATGLATGKWDLPPDAWGRDPALRTTAYMRPPGYAFVLAGIYRLVGGQALGLRMVQMFFGLVNAFLAWWIGRRLLGPSVGVVWAALMVLYWPLLYFQGGLNGAWLLVLIVLVLAVLLFELAQRPVWYWAAAAGAVLGLMALVRPNALLFAPVLIGWGWWVVRRQGLTNRFWPMALAAAVAGALVLTPTTYRNWRIEGVFAPVSANGGLTIFHANNDDSAGFSTSSVGVMGVFGSPWGVGDVVVRMETELGRDLTFSQVSRILGRRALVWIRDHPRREVVLIGRRAALFWGPDEVAHNHVVGADRLQSPLLRTMPIGFPTALGGALVGLVMLILGWRRGWLDEKGTKPTLVALGLFVLTWFVSFLPFFAASLYRVAVVPFLLLALSVALVEIGRSIVARQSKGWYWLGALVVAVSLAHVPLVRADVGMARWHYDRGLAWIYEHQPERALESFRRALDEDPLYGPAHNGMGKILLERGDLEGGLHHFSEAARIQPKDPIAHSNRALVLTRMSRWTEAEREYGVALEWAPTHADWWANVGVCRERLGNHRGAIDAYRSALKADRDHRSAANNLAWLMATSPEDDLRDGKKAVALAQRVVASGASASTLDTLAAALAEAGRFDDAVAAADRALALPDASAGVLKEKINARRALYSQGRPFRDSTQKRPPSDPKDGGDDAIQS
jgi:tetratricopeptide (TPR) repeat protein